MPRKRRHAVEIVSDIGALGFDLQYHTAEEIAAAVAFVRGVNPVLFAWLVKALGEHEAVGSGSRTAVTTSQR